MKFSIITVCLNSEQTIEQTIQSVVRQEYDDYEYIIIDGGSTDGTQEILEKYKENIALMISEPDDGIYDAMNKGVALSSGEVIGIINSDDWYEPGVLEMVRQCFQESDGEVVYGRANIIRDDGEIEVQIPDDIEKIRYEMGIPHPTVFIKKDIYRKFGGFQQKYKIAADYDLMLRLYIKGVRFICLNQVLANFRYGGVSVCQGRRTTEETLEISQNYFSYAPLSIRKTLKDIITHRCEAFYFEKILEDSPNTLIEILMTKLGVGVSDNIAIFGAGKWGMKMYDTLLRKEMKPVLLIDNNEKKWSRSDGGRIVSSPESLRSFKGILLIMVREYSKDILQQVEGICNSEIYCITWNDIAAGCMMTER